MLGGFDDWDRTLAVMDELRRRMGLYLEEQDGIAPPPGASLYGEAGSWPQVNVFDEGNSLVFKADIPGLSEKDIEVSIHQDTLTLSGERKKPDGSGYMVHRQERRALRFSRSFALPCPIDAEKAQANVCDGVLTITLAKIPEAQPKRIAVVAQ